MNRLQSESTPESYTIRPIAPEDAPFLWEMMYHAAYLAEDGATSAEAVRGIPFLAKYAEGWGRAGDLGFVAVETAADQLVGAAWVRRFSAEQKSYPQVDESIPELAIAVLPEHTNRGVGTRLLARLLEAARAVYPAVVLSVRATNPARRLYQRVGFVDIDEWTNRVGGQSFVMKVDFQ